MPLSRLARSSVATIPPSCPLSEAARLMTMLSVGALVIAESPKDEPVGIVTDRNLVKLIGEGLDPKLANVARFVGPPLATVPIGTPMKEVVRLMHAHGVRRLPIVDGEGQLTGIVSLDDVLLSLGEEMADVAGTIRKGLESEHRPPSAHERAL
ncbi:MAG: CBS domain-containing protein [Myxococcota bacterium]